MFGLWQVELNPDIAYPRDDTGHVISSFHAGLLHHPRTSGNPHHPSFPKTLHHSQKYSVIPKNTPSFPKTLRHSREGGNPQFPRTREFIVPSPKARKKYSIIPKNTPSFPRRRESTIPAHAGIHRPIPQSSKKTLRHSREGGNPLHDLPCSTPTSPSFSYRQESTPSVIHTAYPR